MTISYDLAPIQLSLKDAWKRRKGRGVHTFLMPDSESRASHKALLQKLRQQDFLPSDGHFGIGNVLMNLRMVAHSKQSFAILADGNPSQVELFNETIERLVQSKGRPKEEFLAYLEEKIHQIYRGCEDIDLEFYRNEINDAFDDEQYEHLVNLAHDGNMAAIYVDLFDTARMNEIAGAMKDSGKTLGTVYLTNLPMFLKGGEDFYMLQKSLEDIQRFWGNIQNLCNGDQTLVCDAQYEQHETVFERYDRGAAYKKVTDHVLSGPCKERRESHLARIQAFMEGNRFAFLERLNPYPA